MNRSDAASAFLFRPQSLGASFRIYLPSMVIGRGLGLLRILIVGRLILTSEYALVGLAFLLIDLLAALTRLGMPAGLERYVPAYEQAGQLRRFLRRGVVIALAVPAVGVALLLPAVNVIGGLFFLSETAEPQLAAALGPLTVACLLTSWLLSAYYSITSVARGLRMYRALSVMELLHSLLLLVLAVGGIVLVTGTRAEAGRIALWVVVAYAFSLLGATLALGIGLWRSVRGWPQQDSPLSAGWSATLDQLLRFSIFVMAAALVAILQGRYGIWFLKRQSGLEASGLFTYPRDLMQWLPYLALTAWPAAQNACIRLWEQGQRSQAVETLKLVFRLTAWGLWLSAAGVVLATPLVLRLMKPAYQDAGPLLPWLLAFFLLLANMGLPQVYAAMFKRTQVVLLAGLIGLATHVVSSVWLTAGTAGPVEAALGVAQSAALGMAVAFCMLWMIMHTNRLIDPGILDLPANDGAEPAGKISLLGVRELLAGVGPVLLLVPAGAPRTGPYLLAGATVGVTALLIFTDLLISAGDRRLLVRYVAKSMSLTWALVRRWGTRTP